MKIFRIPNAEKLGNFILTVITAFVSTFLMQSLWSHRNSQKSLKFSLRFLRAARAEGTFCDFCVTKKSVRSVISV